MNHLMPTRRQTLATLGGAAATLLLPRPAFAHPSPWFSALNELKLMQGLEVALDGNVWPRFVGHRWRDLSGHGYDFQRADNGPYFTLAQPNPVWVNRLHRARAKFTFVLWVYFGGRDAEQHLVSTTVGNQVGMCFNVQRNSNGLQIAVMNGDPLRALNWIVFGTTQGYSGIKPGQWNFCAVTLDEEAGKNGLTFFLDEAIERRPSSYKNPSTDDTRYPLRLGARGNGSGSMLANGSRIGAAGLWEGVVLSDNQIAALRDRTERDFLDFDD
jgi:hypothetical protein